MRTKSAQQRPRRVTARIGRPVMTALALATLQATQGVQAQLVSSTGDVFPSFTAAPSVDLTGQRIFIGSTVGTVGTTGGLNISGGGLLTAAQIVPGIGGLGNGTVEVTGTNSRINLTGGGPFNGLDIGSWGTGTLSVLNGGSILCSSPLACPFNNISNAAGSSGTMIIDAGSVSGLGSLFVGTGILQTGFGTAGANSSATLSISNAGSLASSGFNAIANNTSTSGNVTGSVTIDGAGSNWLITRDLANGGSQAFLGIAPSSNSNANVMISNGGNLSVVGARANPATDSSLPGINMSTAPGATSTMTVTTGGSIRIGGDSGVLNLGGNSAVASAGATATLNITGGGTVAGNGSNGLVFMAIGQNQGTGTVNVSGAGSQLIVAGIGGPNTQGLENNGGLIQVGRNRNGGGGGNGNLNVSGGGVVQILDNGLSSSTANFMGLQIGHTTDSIGQVTVTGPNSSILVSSTSGSAAMLPSVHVGVAAGSGNMTISNGASVSLQGAGQRNFLVGTGTGSTGALNVTSGGQVNTSVFIVGNVGGAGTATVNNAAINLDGIAFSGADTLGPVVLVGRGAGSTGVLNLQAGAAINLANSVADSAVVVGGSTTAPGGTGMLNMTGASTITFTGSAAGATVQVGGTGGNGIMTMAGASVVDTGAAGSFSVGATAGSTGSLSMAGASKVIGNIVNIGGSSDTAPGGVGTATVSGGGSQLIANGANGFIGVGRGGTGTLSVTDQGAVSAIVLSVGRSGGSGTLTVDNGTIQLSGQQTTGLISGAGMGVGTGGGIGVVNISNGSVVNISNAGSAGAALSVGGSPLFPLGTGTLNVSGSQINITAAPSGTPGVPGLATARIGHDGVGSATFTNSSLNLSNGTTRDGSVIVAGLPGSVGTLVLNGTPLNPSVINASYVGVGATQNPDFDPITNPLQNAGGVGWLVLNDSEVHTDVFEIGALGRLSGNNGEIFVTGDVIIGGIIDPGNSAGRIRINSHLISLPGSQLILEVQSDGSGGFLTDRLVIDSESPFDISNFSIVFRFLGDTDVNAFASTGAFNLDTFLRTGVDADESQGLSNRFADDQTWGTFFAANEISFQSDFFDVGGLSFGSDGGVTGTAARIPEPATWLLMLLGLAALQARSRRRH